MRLSRDEAICLILEFSESHVVSSVTKLNKLLARLNLNYIPIDLEFTLNKYGSYNAELSKIESNDYFSVEEYDFKGVRPRKFKIKIGGKGLYKNSVLPKLREIFTEDEILRLQKKINELSMLDAGQISNDEHKILFVDIDDKFKVEQRVNENYIDMMDMYSTLKKMPEHSFDEIKLKGLIEYCYFLSKYLKEKRFRIIPEEYDFEAYMFDYYFLYLIHETIPFLKNQTGSEEKDSLRINRYYEYFLNSVRGMYPFSIDNPDLQKLVI